MWGVELSPFQLVYVLIRKWSYIGHNRDVLLTFRPTPVSSVGGGSVVYIPLGILGVYTFKLSWASRPQGSLRFLLPVRLNRVYRW